MPTHAAALFADRHAAHAAIEQLAQAGFPRDAISVLMSKNTLEREFGMPNGPDSAEASGIRPARPVGILGAIVAGLVALAPPCGLSLRAAGPLVTALLRGDSQGAFCEALEGAGFADHQARSVDEGVRSGAIVVGVHTSADRAQLAQQLLELSGGESLEAA